MLCLFNSPSIIGKQILKVLDQVVKIEAIDEILCVDDGSTDGTAEIIKEYYHNLKILRNSRNLGKTETVIVGLQQVKEEYILLLGTDLRKVNYKEIQDAVVKIQANEDVDMVVLRRVNAPLFIKLVRVMFTSGGEF